MADGPNYRINNFYPFQVWFLTILTAPIIISISLVEWKGIDLEEITTTISFIGATILFGGALSFPTLAVYYLSFFVLVSREIREKTVKTLLSLIAITGFVVTFYVIGLDILEFTMRDMVLPFSFMVCIVGFSSLFRIRRPVKRTEATVTDKEVASSTSE